MPHPISVFRKHRAALGGFALAALTSYVAVSHLPSDGGLAAEDLTPQAIAAVAAELDPSHSWRTGDWLLDFVEPDEGEGGSEEQIAAMVADLDGLADVSVEKAGFYSEGEHLFRLKASAGAWDRIDDALSEHPLLEGIEPEVYFALPGHASSSFEASSADAPAEAPDKKPPRLDPNDPMFHFQWHMEQIHAPEAWVMNRGEGAVVAVIDTGVAYKDAKGVKQLPDLAGTEFVAGETFAAGLPEGLDDHAHGSHVAGTIAQSTNNGIGVTGVAYKAKIMPLKVLSKEGRGAVPGIANAIRYAADNGASVINMSLGGPLPSNVLAKAIEYAHSKGVTIICAAGNEHRSRVGYPAANKHSVAVSATNFARELAFYSNFGKDIDVAAPGGDTRTDQNGDGAPDGVLQNTIRIGKPLESDYLWFQGTSMAAPHAAGVAALIVAEGITNPDEVERVMKATAVHPNGVKWDKYFGAGIVDARNAVIEARDTYDLERGGLGGLLALFGLGGLGLAGLSRRRNLLALGGLLGGIVIGSGAAGASLAYGIAGAAASVVGLAAFGSPLILSAAIPVALSLLLLGSRPARPVLIGLGIGYAALLLHGALALPTLVSGLPGDAFVDRLWLLANAGIALWMARKVSVLK
jgi:serine protease